MFCGKTGFASDAWTLCKNPCISVGHYHGNLVVADRKSLDQDCKAEGFFLIHIEFLILFPFVFIPNFPITETVLCDLHLSPSV